MIIRRAKKFSGSPEIPGDKSISHRGLIFGALAEGLSEIRGLLDSADVRSTQSCLESLGVRIIKKSRSTLVHGLGRKGFVQPSRSLDCGNSGTTIRLLMGALAGQSITATLNGDDSLSRRPMKRVAEPLGQMGAEVRLQSQDFAPVTVVGGRLRAIHYTLPVSSAQLKGAVILAGLFAEGDTVLDGKISSRDHTERMLASFGAGLTLENGQIQVRGGQRLHGARVQVPRDPSTAAFFIAAAAMIEGAELDLRGVSLNPTRLGFVRVLKRMGAEVSLTEATSEPEPVGRIQITARRLQGTTIEPAEIPSLIDELPIIAVLATQAQGVTRVRGAEELRVKESDRLESIARNLRAMGAHLELTQDGFTIEGPQKLRGGRIETWKDHRIAMAFSIAGLVSDGETWIEDADCVDVSYPKFFADLEALTTHA